MENTRVNCQQNEQQKFRQQQKQSTTQIQQNCSVRSEFHQSNCYFYVVITILLGLLVLASYLLLFHPYLFSVQRNFIKSSLNYQQNKPLTPATERQNFKQLNNQINTLNQKHNKQDSQHKMNYQQSKALKSATDQESFKQLNNETKNFLNQKHSKQNFNDSLIYQQKQTLNKTIYSYYNQALSYVQFNSKKPLNEQMSRAVKFWLMTSNNISANQQLEKIALEEKEYYQKKYEISKYGQLQMCVLIFSYNNQANDRYKRNLDSIFQQDYQNYQIYFIDDKSTDNTFSLVQKYVKNHQLKDKITFLRNQINKGKAQNQFTFGQRYCKPGTLMVGIDGDDELIGKQVFKFLSAIYQKTGYYFIYTQHIIIYDDKKFGRHGYSHRISQNNIQRMNYRVLSNIPSHLRTWISDLFLDLKKEDVMYQKNFAKAGQDCSFLFTLLQKAGKKVAFFDQINYRYVTETGLNDFQLKSGQQKKTCQYFTSIKKRFPVYTQKVTLKIKSN